MRQRHRLLVMGLLMTCAPASPDGTVYFATPRYTLAGSDFWDVPWPSDAWRTASGTVDLSGFPSSDEGLIARYAATYAEEVDGFSAMPIWVAAFAQLPEALSLPSAQETLKPESPVQLVGLGAHCGQRMPLEVVVHRGGDRFLPDLAVQAALVPGAPLPARSTWAFLITEDFAGGTETPADFTSARDTDASLALLDACSEVPRDVAVASVFSTQDPVRVLATLRDAAAALPSPAVQEWSVLKGDSVEGRYRSYRGAAEMPIYQQGDSPYYTQGGFAYDGEGQPVVQRRERVEFVVSVPDGVERPPVVIWQSGARASLQGWIDAPLADELRDAGFAVAKFLPQFHGSRNVSGGDADLHTYNYLNPSAGRSVLLQEAIDVTTFVGMLEETVPLDLGALVGLIGHSQGAEVGAMLAAVEPRLQAYVLHGVGTYLSETIVHRTDPFDVAALLEEMFGTASISRFHPIIQLVQVGADVVDPGNYLAAWPDNGDGSSVLIFNGYHDQDVYWVSMNTMVVGSEATVVEPPGWDVDPEAVWSVDSAPLPISGNRDGAGGVRTVVAWLDADGDHYSLYGDPHLRPLASHFFETASTGVPEVPAPPSR